VNTIEPSAVPAKRQ